MRPKLEELYEAGMEAFGKNDYPAAETAFTQILSGNENFADIQNKMGVIYNQTNRLELAVRAFEKALAQNPGYTEASLNLAVTLGDLGRYEEARQVFEKASQFADKAIKKDKTADNGPKAGMDPFVKGKLAEEHRRVGKLYHDMGLLDDAIEEYRKALRLAPAFADIITALGIALRDQSNYSDAIKEFSRAIEINAHYIPARLHLGVTYYSQGFYGLAEEEWRKALKIDPDNSAIKTYLNFVRPQKT